MTAATTVTQDGMSYGCDANGQVLWATYTREPEPAQPSLPAEVWHCEEFNADRAHEAMVALCRGS